MKRITTLVVSAAFGLTLAGCASTTPPEEHFTRQLIKDVDRTPVSSPAQTDTYVNVVFPMEKQKKARVKSINNPNISVIEALNQVKAYATVIPMDSGVDLNKRFAIKSRSETLAQFLEHLTGVTDYHYVLDGNAIKVSSQTEMSWSLAGFSSQSQSSATVGQSVSSGGGASSSTSDSTSAATSSSSSSSGTSSEGGNTTVTITNNVDQFADIIVSAQAILGANDSVTETTTTDSTGTSTSTSSNSAFGAIDDEIVPLKPWVVGVRNLGIINASGAPSKMKVLDKYMRNLSKMSTKQVNLDIKVIDVTLGDENARGIDWNLLYSDKDGSIGFGGAAAQALTGGGAWSITTAYQLGSFTLDHFINFLADYGEVSLLSQPNVTTTNGTTAFISNVNAFSFIAGFEQAQDAQGQISITPELQRIKVGITLAVTPRVLEDDRVLVEVVPVVSSLESFSDFNSQGFQFQAPNVALQELATQVVTRSGKTIQLGGLISKKVSKSISKLPLDGLSEKVSDALFKSVAEELSRRELIISLTPTLVDA